MKTKLMVKMILVGVLLMNLQFAFAKGGERGDGAGNGGGAVVCRDTNQTVVYASMYDNVEWKELGLEESSTVSVDVLLKKMMTKLKKANRWFARDLANELKFVKKTVNNFVKLHDIILMKVPDSYHDFVPRNCHDGSGIRPKYEQVVNYRDRITFGSRVKVSREIFSRFSETSKASLYNHEAVYKLLREEYGHTSSLKARELNGHLLAWGAGLIDDARAHSILKSILNVTEKKYSLNTIRKRELELELAKAVSTADIKRINKLISTSFIVNGDVVKVSTAEINDARKKYKAIHSFGPLLKAARDGDYEKLKRLIVVSYVTIGGVNVAPDKKTVQKALNLFKESRLKAPYMKAIIAGDVDRVSLYLATTFSTPAGDVSLTTKDVNEGFRMAIGKYMLRWKKYADILKKGRKITKRRRMKKLGRELRKRDGMAIRYLKVARRIISGAPKRFNLIDSIFAQEDFFSIMGDLTGAWARRVEYIFGENILTIFAGRIFSDQITALMFSSWAGDLKMAKLILARQDANYPYVNASLDGRVGHGATAYLFAKKGFNKSKAMRKLLEKHGVNKSFQNLDCLNKYISDAYDYRKSKKSWGHLDVLFISGVSTLGIGALGFGTAAIVFKVWEVRARKMVGLIKKSRKAVKDKTAGLDLVNYFEKDFLKRKKVRRALPGTSLAEKAVSLVKLIDVNSRNSKLCKSKRPLTMWKLRRMIIRGKVK